MCLVLWSIFIIWTKKNNKQSSGKSVLTSKLFVVCNIVNNLCDLKMIFIRE